MNIIQQTLELLEVDTDFIVKNKTVKSAQLTAGDLITKVVNDAGNTKITELFKGHDQIKIRQAFKLVFDLHPKPSPATEWYLHILSICGLKRCPACDAVKLLDDFAVNKAMKSSNRDSWCKFCTKEYRLINASAIANTKANWQKDNPSKTAASTARRRAAKKQAAPIWANSAKIQEIYDKCPEGSQVDHWAPLQGDTVCGLHTEFNLQYLISSDNISKGNKFSDTDPYYGEYPF